MGLRRAYKGQKRSLRRQESNRSAAWKAAMLTLLPTLRKKQKRVHKMQRKIERNFRRTVCLAFSRWASGTQRQKAKLASPGVRPRSTAWKAAMLTVIPPTLGRNETAFYSNKMQRVKIENRFSEGLVP
ncbi:hypothetical protein TNCT_167141 [Trichonephila clavata]|uniref:Uncharacterized protein n=1 Tax=Trichonephila clavata TaxID=2740835 RepID=A0A8X6LM07_TRICU|nr:hypothetical protein TNCT_167141 [Trichonephila clavata]